MLLERAPLAGLALIREMIGFETGIKLEDIPSLDIRTQSVYSEGRPDMEIILRGDCHIMVEVKVQWEPSSDKLFDQLSRYRKELDKRGATNRFLVLLTNAPPPNLGQLADSYRRWCQVGECLRMQLKNGAIQETIARHTTEQFIGFLQEQGMTSEPVGWELSRGIMAWRCLDNMILQALKNHKINPSQSLSAEWGGYNSIKDRTARAWIGITWKEPTVIRFETFGYRVEGAPGDFGESMLANEKDHPGGRRWVAKLDLESEDVHFFARSTASQQAEIEKFVKKCFVSIKDFPTK
jgi:hypothetical protein